MKTRNGFVSNSSTASFVIVGIPVDVPDFENDIDGTLEDEFYNTTSFIGEPDGIVRGEFLAKESNYQLPCGALTWQEIQELFEKVARENNVDKGDVKLYFGTMQC
jgi:hypothetical protein